MTAGRMLAAGEQCERALESSSGGRAGEQTRSFLRRRRRRQVDNGHYSLPALFYDGRKRAISDGRRRSSRTTSLWSMRGRREHLVVFMPEGLM